MAGGNWMRVILWLAAVYNVLWGAIVMAAPLWLFQLAGMEPPNYPQLWQCIGMMVAVYGLGYAIAATNPIHHWPIVLVGFLGKVFGPIGFVLAGLKGELPWVAGWTIVTNDLIWWVPFFLILHQAHRANRSQDGLMQL